MNSPRYAPMIAQLVLGEYDEAVTSLERGVTAHEPLFGLLSVPCFPILDPLQRHPRFIAVVRKIGGTRCPVTTTWPIAMRPAVPGARLPK